MTNNVIHRIQHDMSRVNISTRIPFEEFCAALEKAAPAYDAAAFEHADDWDAVVAAMTTAAPHGLITYARLDARPMLALTGTRVQAIEYLLGNHVIAATMFRHDPNALLYAPLRVLVFSDDLGDAVFAIDRPSTVFAGLGNDEISMTGHLLDSKVTGLLTAIGLKIGEDHDDVW